MFRQCRLLLHDSFIVSRATVLDNAAFGCWLQAVSFFNIIQEIDHLLQVLLTIHTHTMTSLRHEGGLGLHTGSLQDLKELLALTARHHIVLLTMEDDDRGIVLVDVCGSTQTHILFGLIGKFGIEQHVFRTVLTHLHTLTAVHGRQVNRTRPVTGSIDGTALVSIIADIAFEVNLEGTDLGLLLATGSGCDGSQMTTRRETAGGNDERSVPRHGCHESGQATWHPC